LYWYVWAALTPLVIWFARHFDVERSNWPRTLSALIGFGLLIAPLQGAIETGIALLIEWRILHATAAELARRRQLMARLILIETFGNFIIYFLIVAGVYAYDYYQKYREREMRSLDLEGRLAQAELQNLKMQLHPHFLFNTLHTISVLMMRNVEAANQMLIRLSDLLRVTLDSIGTEEVSLKQELDFLRGYLEIEQTRFQDRLTVKMDVDPATLDARVPNLILQPLVENAIRHGIASRPDEGLIVIRATLMDKTLCLQVRDNGPGLSSEDLASLNQGVGLTNTQARLRQLYGSSHRFEISNASEGGLAVTVSLPFHINEDRD
jgi:signal transduction histidine kinase